MAWEPDEPDTLPGSVDEMTRGVDSVLGREVAMVSLPPARGEALTVRTEQVRRLAGLHHPNLIEVYDVDGLAEDTESTLVMQSVDGRSLDAVVASAPWPAVSVAHVGAQVADGLAHAHAHGVVHGGIGPASLVVDETLHAWLTGFTAALRPAPAATPTAADGGPTVSSPTEDVVALGATLRALLDTSTPLPAVLDDALRAMTAGHCDARTAASALAEAAETCAHGDAAGGVVPMAVYSARISTSRSGASDASGPASGPTPSSGSGPASPSQPSSQPSPVPAAAAAAAAAVAAPRAAAPAGSARPAATAAGSPTPAAPAAARRSGRQAHRGLRVAALGAATMAVAVASSAVLWAANSFSAPLPSPTGAAQGSPAVVADPALGQVAGPPAGVDTGVAVPGDARPPLLDVSTLGSNEERSSSPSQVAETSDPTQDSAPSGGSWFHHGPPVLAPPDGWHPPHRPPWVPPRPTTTTPPSTTTTVPPTTTTTPKPTSTTPKPTTTTPEPTTTTPPKTTKPTTTTNSTGTSTGSTGQGVAGQGSGAGQGAAGTGSATSGAGGAGVAPSARAAGPVSPTPAVVAAGR